MRKLAKISAVLAAMVLALAFVGCNSDDDDDDDDPSAVTVWYYTEDGDIDTIYFYDDGTFELNYTMGSVTVVGCIGVYSGDTTKDGKIKMTIKKELNEDMTDLVDVPAGEDNEVYATIIGNKLTIVDDEGDTTNYTKK